MERTRIKKRVKQLGVLFVLIGLGYLVFDHFRNVKRRAVLSAMAQECHPVRHDLETGRIRAGDDVEQVILRTSPHAVERQGNLVGLKYYPQDKLSYTGIKLIALDGKLVSGIAWSCTWMRIFFTDLPDSDFERSEQLGVTIVR